MPERPPSDLKRVTAQYHAAVQNLTENALTDLQGRWQGVQATLDLKIKRLTDAIAAAQARGETVNVAWLTQARRLEQLRQAVQGDVSAFADGAADIVQQSVSGAVDLGQAAAQAALSATVPPGVNYTFGVPPSDVTEELAGALQPGAPLTSLFGQLGSQVAAFAQQALFTGVALGEGPRQIAQRLTWATNMAPRRAEVIARTETLRAWRHAQFANYQANRDVVQQWMWAADFGPRCCGACIAMDGTFHNVDTELDDHICGRCSAIPITRSWAEILSDAGMSQDQIDALGLTETSGMAWAQSRESGEHWLSRQSTEVQNQILGPAKAEAWRQQAFPLERVVGVVHDPQWGSSIQERSLKQMGLDAQKWLRAARQNGAASSIADEEALAAAHAESSVTVAAEQRAEQVAQAKAAADEWYAAIARSIDAGRAGGLTAEEAKAAANEWYTQVTSQLRPGGLSVEDVARAMEQRFGLVANPDEEGVQPARSKAETIDRILGTQPAAEATAAETVDVNQFQDVLQSAQARVDEVRQQWDDAKAANPDFRTQDMPEVQQALYDLAKAQAIVDAANGGRGAIIYAHSYADPFGAMENLNAATERMFGRALSRDELGALVGAPEGAYVNIQGFDSGGDGLSINLHGPSYDPMGSGWQQTEYDADRYLLSDGRGGWVMLNSNFGVREDLQGSGVGAQIFSDEARQLSDLGVRYIETNAAGAGNMGDESEPLTANGFYTWPRFGYLGHLPEYSRELLQDAAATGDVPAKWARYTTIQQLMRSSEGRAWWKSYGTELDGLRFDLRPDSLSMRILDAYLREKGLK
jgi:hypothetical protein